MSDPQEIERDLKEYLEKEPNLRRADRYIYLKAIFDKHFSIHSMEHVVTSADFFEFMSVAKGGFSTQRMPVRISRKQLDASEAANISVIEAFISYLNRNKLLRKLVKFDYTE